MKTSYPLFKNLELNLEYETVNTAKQGPTPVPLIIHYDEIYNSPPPSSCLYQCSIPCMPWFLQHFMQF